MAQPSCLNASFFCFFSIEGGTSSSGMDVQRYIAELQELRNVLVAAKAEQETQDSKIAEVRQTNRINYNYTFIRKIISD